MTAKEIVTAMDAVDNTHPATMEMARQARRNQRLATAGDEIEQAVKWWRKHEDLAASCFGTEKERAEMLVDNAAYTLARNLERIING